jgi:predicted transcriptional regulator of viral defense system
MIYTYIELEKLFKSDYQIKKAIADGKIFKIEKGIYSFSTFVHPLEVMMKKYPHAIFTMDSAFYFHGFTEVIPDKYYLATKRNTTKITGSNILQIFVWERLLEIGKIQIDYEGVRISIYSKERMLIELIRNKKGMAFDYYKEIISSYRRRVNELDVRDIEEYTKNFEAEDYIFKTIQEEVF